MNTKDELQRQLEQEMQTNRVDEDDHNAYSHVFRALEKQPLYSLPSDFADKIVAAVESKNEKDNLRDYLGFLGGIIAITAGFVYTILKTNVTIELKIYWGFLHGLTGFKGVLIFGILFIAILHYIDRRFIRASASDNIKKVIPFL